VSVKAENVVTHTVGRLPAQEDSLAALIDHAQEIARRSDASLIHGIYASVAGFAATIVAASLGLPSVVSIRGNDLGRDFFRRDEHPFVAHALSQATLVTGVSREACTFASQVYDRDAYFVGNSVDCDAFRPETKDNSLIAALGLGRDPIIGYCGELREKKGIRFLLPAFAAVARKRPARLLLVGGIRRDARAAYDEFTRLAPDAAARVHLAEYERSPKRLRRLLALCDLVVFPSLREGMPNAVLEAMACGRPVLATATGGHLDLIEHGRTGALLPLTELDRLPAAIVEYLDYAAREELGAAARAYVQEHHRPEDESAAWAEVYARARAIGGRKSAAVIDLYPRAARPSVA
jgi:glycosyltransferase involved in cell wall biosynthesis